MFEWMNGISAAAHGHATVNHNFSAGDEARVF
jgi:hypothetical protein